MNIKKAALASAIAAALTSSVWAETTTVGVDAIFDRTTIEAGGIANMAVLGLNVTGEVDILGEQSGSTIQAIINATLCDVKGGCTTPDCSEEKQDDEPDESSGQFAASVNYLNLAQGNGRVYFECPSDITEETIDTITVNLQEQLPDGTPKPIGITKTFELTILPSSETAPEELAIVGFIPSDADTHGMVDCFGISDECSTEADGIWAAMTVGQSGAQIVVADANEKAMGTVTVTMKGPQGGDVQEYTYTGEMVNGQVTVTLDNQITTAGLYHIEASVESGEKTLSSVGLVYPDVVKVYSTGVPTQLKLMATKERIGNPDFTQEPFADEMIKQGTEVTAQLMDEYGNATSHCNPEINETTGMGVCTTGGELTITVEDSNGVISSAALNLVVPNQDEEGDTEAKSGNAILGDENGELLLNVGASGTASLVAKLFDATGNSTTIADSAALELNVVPTSLTAEVLADFGTDQLAGEEFDGFEVNVINDSGQRHVDTNNNPVTPGGLTVTNLGTGEVGQANFNPDVDNVVETRFLTQTDGNNQYLISDSDGLYAQMIVEASAILAAAATKVEFQNAHGTSVTDVPPEDISTDKKYYTAIPEVALRLFDDYGNKVTGEQPLTSDDTGQFTVESSNAAAIIYNTPEGTYGIPGRFDMLDNGLPTLAIAQYDATGTAQFAGGDQMIVGTFTKPGLANQNITLTTTIPAYSGVTKIVSYLEALENKVPVNSEVAISVEVLNEEGKVFIDPDPSASTGVTLTIGGQEGDTISPKQVLEIQWATKTLTQADCDTIGGTYDNSICITEEALTDAQCELIGSLLRQEQCMNVTETVITSGETLDFNATDGRKVFAVDAGSVDGQFSLTFTSVDDTTVTTTQTLQVGKVSPQSCEPGATDANLMCGDQDQCLAASGVWTGNSCMAGDLMTATDVNEPDYKNETRPGKAAFGGGALDTTLSVEDSKFVQNLESLPAESEVKITGVIKVDENHLGYPGSLVVGVIHFHADNSPYGYQWYNLEGCDTKQQDVTETCAVWGWDILLWNFDSQTGMPYLFDMKPLRTIDALGEYYQLNLYTGNMPDGLWGIYYGYVVTDGPYNGALIYNEDGIIVEVKAE